MINYAQRNMLNCACFIVLQNVVMLSVIILNVVATKTFYRIVTWSKCFKSFKVYNTRLSLLASSA
jgi:hypothetical protein